MEQPVISVPTRARTRHRVNEGDNDFPGAGVLIFQPIVSGKRALWSIKMSRFVLLIDPESGRYLLYHDSQILCNKSWSRRLLARLGALSKALYEFPGAENS